ncbi:hypothetical protein MF271_15715 [Deinococcus sp. KNUC1210]|uniref:hypothetical protein n=1 Tax=Deinococcus sp. KNUC1210 TaxID=2917691 RepID=UPI001EF13D5F|nr:hypothetical protein [Deinococcus sp. KNUC1210]ULH15359.1 hypothetical protein MF271_15715 [Deinococcus sp. KNUC1210]
MKRLPVLLTLLLAASAVACPVKKGFIASGLLPTPAGYMPKCDDWYASSRAGLMSSLGSGQKLNWYEMYAVTPKALKLDALVQQLTAHGYTFVMKTDYGGQQGRRLRDKAGRFLDVSVSKVQGTQVFVGLSLIKF